MPDINPLLLRRMLALRQFSIFAHAELAELAMIAENLVETRFRSGAVVAHAAVRVPAVHFVLDGRIEAARAWGPREVFGALEVFAGRMPRVAAVATTETRTLQLSASDLGEVLEDTFGVLLAVVRELASYVLAADRPPPRPAGLPSVARPLGLVERLIVLRQVSPFVGASLQGLSILAHASDEISWPAGGVVARAGELASGSLLVLEGALHARRPAGTSALLGPGHAIGALETLAGTGHAATVVATTPVRALHSGATAMLDMLEDHPDVGLSMIATLARALLEIPWRAIQAAGERANGAAQDLGISTSTPAGLSSTG